MRAVLAALVFALCQGPSPALAETWLTASIGSYHFERKDYCEVNPGVGFEHGIAARVRFIAGTYQNSYCRASSYVGASWMPLGMSSSGALRAGAALIAVAGYGADQDAKNHRLRLAPLPALAWDGARFGFNLVLLPPHDEFKGGLGLQLKVNLQ